MNIATYLLFYSSNYLEEVTHVRSFGMPDLWANIGGYVGMVMGVSILQLIGMTRNIFLRLKLNTSTKKSGKLTLIAKVQQVM